MSASKDNCHSNDKNGSNDDGKEDNYNLGYLSSQDAAALDVELMDPSSYSFSLEQLMELAGLSVAEAVYHTLEANGSDNVKIILVCGPGNNGGDGLVAARHLVHFYAQKNHVDVSIVYPKRSKKQHFVNLVRQCEDLNIPVLEEMPELWWQQNAELEGDQKTVVVDAIFGFSFKGEPREPFKSILESMAAHVDDEAVSIISVDVPSGWDVDKGNEESIDKAYDFTPQVLVSLTTPKLCSQSFKGKHFVGGRFLPDSLAAKYGIRMPPYPGVSQVMDVTHYEETVKSADDKDDNWREEYAKYLADKENDERHAKKERDKHSKAIYLDDGKSDDDDWAAQYQKYLEEKYEEELKEKRAPEKVDDSHKS